MKKLFAKSAIAAAVALSSTVALADFSANVSLTNDYRFRGVSQSAENTAIQGGFDYEHESGLFAGVWGSNVDFGADDPTRVELDLYGGYWGEINDDLSYDVTLYRYTYPGTSGIDYNEVSVGVDFMGARVAYWHSNDFFATKETGQYLEANYSMDLAENLALSLHAGYNFGKALEAEFAGTDSQYTDYSITLSTTMAEMDLSLTYVDTDIDEDNAFFGKVKEGTFANQDALVFTVSKSM